MDNASKALIMAGGVLIAIMIIGVSMYILAGARGFAEASNTQAELSAVESFNRYYQSFDSKILGIDVLNIYNKAEDDTKRANSMHPVSVVVPEGLIQGLRDPTGSGLFLEDYSYSITGYDSDGYITNIVITN